MYATANFATISKVAQANLPVADKHYRISLVLPRNSLQHWLRQQNWLAQLPSGGLSQLECAIVPVATFTAAPRMEDTLQRWLQRICLQQAPLSLTFNNIGAAPPEMWYLRTLNAYTVQPLITALRSLDMYLSAHQYAGISAMPRIGVPVASGLLNNTDFASIARLAAAECDVHVHCSALELAVQKGEGYQRLQLCSLAGQP